MKKEKFENLSFEEKRNYTKKKLQKSCNICLGIVLGGMCSLLAGTFFYLGSMGASTANWNKAKEKGYEVFNQNYRVEQQTKLYEQFKMVRFLSNNIWINQSIWKIMTIKNLCTKMLLQKN